MSAAFEQRLAKTAPPHWIIEPVWDGETIYIVGGGQSVLKQNLEQLRHRKTIVINTSYRRMPWANYCIFADDIWFRYHRDKLKIFNGYLVSAGWKSAGSPIWRRVNRRKPPGLSDIPGTVTVQNTTMTAAIDMAAQLGGERIVILGLDGRRGHHHEPHPWATYKKHWREKNWNDQFAGQIKDLATQVEPLKQRGIEVLNASPGSAVDLWPIVKLEMTL